MINNLEPTIPVPIIDAALCDGCGLCITACACGALAMRGDKAVVARPDVCGYDGLCEMICLQHAISRPFLIVLPQTGK